MKTIGKAATAVAIALTAALAPAAPALAGGDHDDRDETFAELVGVVHVLDRHEVQIQVKYRCYDDLHVWASVKQSEDRHADHALTEEGSGYNGVAAAWSQTHDVDIDCDGDVHTERFVIDRDEYGYGRFEHGKAYVQFCLVDGEELVASDMRFLRVW
jgi:hypothetical protein